jgi:hypothetical protein
MPNSSSSNESYDETAYAKKVVEWFERRDWTVYKEVRAPAKDRVVDVYAIQGDKERPRKSHAIEVKKSFTFRVLEQAYFWKQYAKNASVAVPAATERRARKFGQRICTEFGLGVFEVIEGDHGPMYARQKKTPGKNHPRDCPELFEEQKMSVAGTADDEERWTRFDRVANKLGDLVEQDPGISLHDAISEIDHHYKNDDSAYSTLKRAIPDYAVPGVELVWRRSTAYLFERDQ